MYCVLFLERSVKILIFSSCAIDLLDVISCFTEGNIVYRKLAVFIDPIVSVSKTAVISGKGGIPISVSLI